MYTQGNEVVRFEFQFHCLSYRIEDGFDDTRVKVEKLISPRQRQEARFENT